MNKKNKGRIKSKYTLVILTIICISLICLTLTSTINIQPVRNIAVAVLIPIQNGLNKAGSWLVGQQSTQKSADELAAENDELREKVANLQEQNTVLTENTIALEKLQELYNLDQDYHYSDKVAADVIAKDPGVFYDQFTFNRGENDGITKEMNVISGGGLVGIVTETGPNWANVRAIINEDSNVSAMVLLTSDNCIVSGSPKSENQGKLVLSDLSVDANVSVGAKIVTSNISNRYLPGILIGYIDEINHDQNNLMQTGTVLPVADFAHLQHVLVILETKKTGAGS